jgi:hypothetical protein
MITSDQFAVMKTTELGFSGPMCRDSGYRGRQGGTGPAEPILQPNQPSLTGSFDLRQALRFHSQGGMALDEGVFYGRTGGFCMLPCCWKWRTPAIRVALFIGRVLRR